MADLRSSVGVEPFLPSSIAMYRSFNGSPLLRTPPSVRLYRSIGVAKPNTYKPYILILAIPLRTQYLLSRDTVLHYIPPTYDGITQLIISLVGYPIKLLHTLSMGAVIS